MGYYNEKPLQAGKNQGISVCSAKGEVVRDVKEGGTDTIKDCAGVRVVLVVRVEVGE